MARSILRPPPRRGYGNHRKMQRELLILRHAKSDWEPGQGRDFDRVLSKRGRRVSKKLGRWMRTQDLIPEQIVSSTAQRARQTAMRVCRFAELSETLISWRAEIYEAQLETLLGVVSAAPPDCGRLLLVGHNPGLDYLVRYLADDSLEPWDAQNLMPTAALARLLMPEDWRNLTPASAEVASISRPKALFTE